MPGEEEEFIKVVRNRRGRGHKQRSYPRCGAVTPVKVPADPASDNDDEERCFISLMKAKISHAIDYLKQSTFDQYFVSLISDSVARVGKTPASISKIVSYGIGNFTLCLIARYQFALLLIVKDALQINVELFEPVLTGEERKILSAYGVHIIPNNEEGKRLVEGLTVFYMPHLPNQLINNLLYSNWSFSKLQECVVVANSFKRISECKEEIQDLIYIYKAVEIVGEELEVENSFHFRDVFNDTSVHVFPPQKLSKLSEEFWLDCEPPAYSSDNFVSCFQQADSNKTAVPCAKD